MGMLLRRYYKNDAKPAEQEAKQNSKPEDKPKKPAAKKSSGK